MSPFIKTVEQLRDFMYIASRVCKEPPQRITDDDLKWFVCICEAENHSGDNLRECAELFLYGVTAVTTLSQVQDYIDMIYEGDDDEDFQLFNDTCIRASVYRFYSQYETAQTLMDTLHD